ncbi:alpha/beta hydrolase [Candidatus Pacearchaeota archaeon]|nr:alpha/beta hydrolase [Candidatus Pacearchaeota archaeon]
MKKVYLIHGWGGSSRSEGWFSDLKQQLSEKGINVKAFDMPNTNTPRIEKWVGFLQSKIKTKDIGEETYFVGHSIGCQTILRFLEFLPNKIKVGGCVFVAGWFNLTDEAYETEEDRKIAKPWLEMPINFDKVKSHTKNFLAIFSDDDPLIPLSDADLFKEKLNARILVKKKQGHFNEASEIPEILEFLTK